MFFNVQSNHRLIITDHHLEIAAKAAALTVQYGTGTAMGKRGRFEVLGAQF